MDLLYFALMIKANSSKGGCRYQIKKRGKKKDEVLVFYLVKFWMILLVSTLWSWQGFGGVWARSLAAGWKHVDCWHYLTKRGLGVYRGSNMIGQKEEALHHSTWLCNEWLTGKEEAATRWLSAHLDACRSAPQLPLITFRCSLLI